MKRTLWGRTEDLLLAEEISEEDAKKTKDVGDSRWHEDVSIAFEGCLALCALKTKNKFTGIKFSVNFTQP